VTYCWKGLEENYNFVVGKNSIRIWMQNYDHTKFQTHLLYGETKYGETEFKLFPQAPGWGTISLRRNLNLVPSRHNNVPPKK